MNNREQRDWIWKRYEEVRDMAYDMACADAERLTREAAEKLKAAHKALVDAEKQSCTWGEPAEVVLGPRTEERVQRATAPVPLAPLNGVALIAQERQRQIESEGWTPEHDDGHDGGEILTAAVCYAQNWYCRDGAAKCLPPSQWPWDREWWKPSDDEIRNLVKAGALIAAEIDRLQRLQAQESAE